MAMRKFWLEVYKDGDGEWRWRSEAMNNKKTANGGEGYGNKADAFDMATTMLSLPDISIDEPDKTNDEGSTLIWYFERE